MQDLILHAPMAAGPGPGPFRINLEWVFRWKPLHNDGVKTRDSDPARMVRQALDRLVRERAARKPGGHRLEAQLRGAELRLPLPPAESGVAAEEFSRRLVSRIDELIDDLVQQAAAFRPGHAWCHRCESLICEHSRPLSSRHVFVGYAPTGLPRWEDFAQWCLDLRHPQVDQLYDDPPVLLTEIQDGATLQGQMLAVFENGSYELVGQLVAGFFSVKARAEEGRGVLALTVQVAASRARGKRLRLGLNLLGRTPAGDDLERLWDRHEELPWRKGVRWAQAALSTVTTHRDTSHAALARRVEGILQGLARRFEREHRARSRRTRHAELRHASGHRPTPKALEDARAVSSKALFVDDRSGAIVVLGDRGRTHFFTAEGRLVSSVRYSRDAIERKLKSELWRPAPDDLLVDFRSKLPGS